MKKQHINDPAFVKEWNSRGYAVGPRGGLYKMAKSNRDKVEHCAMCGAAKSYHRIWLGHSFKASKYD